MDWWQHLWATVSEQIHDHGAKILTGLVLMGVGWYFGNRKARRNWRKREFFDRLNISLNTVRDGKLLIRTLVEKRVDDIYLNAAATAEIVHAAQKTSAQDSTLPLPQADYWYYLNPILNELSEQFAVGLLKRDQGAPVTSARYVIALTSECAGDLRMRKVRAMVVQRSLLEQLPAEPPAFESPHHLTRWETLKQLAGEWSQRPWKFIEVELCV